MDFQISNIKDEILIIENVIPPSLQNAVIQRVQGDQHFPWFLLHRIGHPDQFGPGTVAEYADPNITDDVGFFHMAFDGSSSSTHYDFFRSILEFFLEKTNIKIVTKIENQITLEIDYFDMSDQARSRRTRYVPVMTASK